MKKLLQSKTSLLAIIGIAGLIVLLILLIIKIIDGMEFAAAAGGWGTAIASMIGLFSADTKRNNDASGN